MGINRTFQSSELDSYIALIDKNNTYDSINVQSMVFQNLSLCTGLLIIIMHT